MPSAHRTRSVQVGRYVLAVGDAPAGTLILPGALQPGDPGFVDPAELSRALAQEADERPSPGAALEGAVVTLDEYTARVEEAEDLTRAVLAGDLLALERLPDRLNVMFDVLERLDREDKWEEALRLARALNGLLALALRWFDLVRSLWWVLRAAQRLPGREMAVGWAQHELGTLHLAAEDPQGAEPHLERAREIRRRLDDREGLAATEQSLGVLCRERMGGPPERRSRMRRGLLAGLAALALLAVGGVAGARIDDDDDPTNGAAPRLTAEVDGPGTVTTSPAGIRCPDRCEAEFTAGRPVSLSAAARPGATFAGWSGGGCEGRGPCQVTLRESVTVTARFSVPPVPPGEALLTVVRAGRGARTGTVTSTPGGISCGQDCSESFPSGSTVDLTAVAGARFAFTGWTGTECPGTGICSVTMSDDLTVTATFERAEPPDVTLTTSVTGTGTIDPSCPQGCSFRLGAPVTLTATPLPPDNSVEGWTGCTPVDANTCVATMSADLTVGVSFVFREPED